MFVFFITALIRITDKTKLEKTLLLSLESVSDTGLNPSSQDPSFTFAKSTFPKNDSKVQYQLKTSKAIDYGSGSGQLGMIRNSGGSPIGPESFGFDNGGNLAIGDLVNHRILFFSKNGDFIAATSFADVAINDFFIDRYNNIYVFSQPENTLVQYNSKGSAMAVISLSRIINTRGYFHLEGDSVYHAEACERDVLIGKIEEGKLRPPTDSEYMQREGIVTESGCSCLVKISRLKGVSLSVAPLNGDRALEYKIDTPGVVSARFIGEDKQLNRYVQIERIREGTDRRIVLSVIKFDGSGLHSTFECTENNYESWTSKLLAVREDGTVVQFIPQQEKARINIYMHL